MEKGFVFSAITLLLFNSIAITVSLTSEYWVYKSQGISTRYVGLFRGCWKVGQYYKLCHSTEEPPVEIEIVKGLVIAALLFSIIPLILVLQQVFECTRGQKWLNGGAYMLAVAGVFLIVGIVLYIVRVYMNEEFDYDENGYTLHVGFVFACVGVLVSFICAGLLKKMGPYINTETEVVAI